MRPGGVAGRISGYTMGRIKGGRSMEDRGVRGYGKKNKSIFSVSPLLSRSAVAPEELQRGSQVAGCD